MWYHDWHNWVIIVLSLIILVMGTLIYKFVSAADEASKSFFKRFW